jgi:3-ketosteroid 9alpha-monooxygenase subunit A
VHADDRCDPAGRTAGAGDEPDRGQERDRVGLEAAEPGRLEQPEEPGLGQRLDRLGGHHAGVDNPLLCAEDGPVYQLRRWYEQFYTDVEDIKPYMVERYEFEVDTTRAVAEWDLEVAANLAARPGGAAGA